MSVPIFPKRIGKLLFSSLSFELAVSFEVCLVQLYVKRSANPLQIQFKTREYSDQCKYSIRKGFMFTMEIKSAPETELSFREEKERKIIIIIIIIVVVIIIIIIMMPTFICFIVNCNKIDYCKVMKHSIGKKEERR